MERLSDRSNAGVAEKKPAFIYDDGCPMCRGYTSLFTSLGWADRAGFSTIDDTVLADLDLDKARHFIPLHDPATGTVRYGLDGILDVVGAAMPRIGSLGRHHLSRRLLDPLYWLITYNRRHIVSGPPPACGFDCAPDLNRAAVRTYLVLCVALAGGFVALGAPVVPVVGAGAAATGLFALRRPAWAISTHVALGHAATVSVAGAAVGAVAATVASPWAAGLATLAVAARKIWLRRWMLTERNAPEDCRL